MRRLIGLVLIAALVAPALAVCAGVMPAARRSSEHDCCPKDIASVMAAPAASQTGACCRMSTDAAQRGAIPAADIALLSTPLETIIAFWPAAPASPVLGHRLGSTEPPHIARHLLLSVLIV